MRIYKPFWQHRSEDMFSEFYYSTPYKLLEHNDRYYEDYYISSKSSPELMLRTVGFRYCSPDYHFININHTGRNAMLFILEGTGYVNGSTVQNGTIVFFDCKRLCNFYSSIDDPCIYAWVTFKGGNSDALLKKIGLFEENIIYHTVHTSEIASIIYDMLYVEHKEYNIELYMESQLIRILSLSTNENSEQQSLINTLSRKYVDLALQYITEHFKDIEFRISDVSKAIGVSENYMRVLFKNETGISMQDYVTQQRINAATTLLNASNYNINQIAEICGYSSYRQFSKQFKQRLGISPSNFKSQKI